MMSSRPKKYVSKKQQSDNSPKFISNNKGAYHIKIPIPEVKNNLQKIQKCQETIQNKKKMSDDKEEYVTKKKSYSDALLGPWDDDGYESHLSSKIQRKKPNWKQQQPSSCQMINKLKQKPCLKFMSCQHNNCLRCENHEKARRNTAIKFEPNYEKHENTAPQQKLKWCLQLQFMLKKRKKISNMLKMKHTGHYRSYTLASDLIPEKNLTIQSKTSSFIDQEFLSKINPQKLKDSALRAFHRNSEPEHQTLNIKKQVFGSIHSSRNRDYAGLMRQRTHHTTRHRTINMSTTINQNYPTKLSNNSNKQIHSKPQDTKHRVCSKPSLQAEESRTQNVSKVRSIKDKLKRIKYFTGRKREQTEGLSSRKKIQTVRFNQFYSPHETSEQRAGFGSGVNEIDSCTISRVRYSTHDSHQK